MTRTITTSWDDGHPCDRRLADLLGKYGLKGTFYIPRQNEEHTVMNERQIAELGRHFEIGGHTLRHRNLRRLSRSDAQAEIKGSFQWLRTLLQKDPVSFCPPYGAYSRHSLDEIYAAGFKVIRTVELLSPGQHRGLIPTTIQMFDHSPVTLFKHLVKRGRVRNLRLWIGSQFTADTRRLVDHYLEHIATHGGTLHLWGHSWEIDRHQYWDKLERIFSAVSTLQGFTYAENGELVKTT